MRANIFLSLALLLAAVSAADSNASSGGSLEKLLARVAHERNSTVSNGTISTNRTALTHHHMGSGPRNHTHGGPRPFKPKTATAASETAGSVELPAASAAARMARVVKKAVKEERYYQGASIIQDDTPTSVIPVQGGGANTPTNVPVPPTFPALAPVAATSVDQAAALASVSAAHSRGVRASLRSKEKAAKSSASAASAAAAAATTPAAAKRWVWGTAIIQDNTPSSGVPAVGANANLLNSAGGADTPTVTLVAPTFPALTTAQAAAATSVLDAAASSVVVVGNSQAAALASASSIHSGGRTPLKAGSGRTPLSASH